MNNDQNFLDESIFKTTEDYQIASAGRRFTNYIIDLITLIMFMIFISTFLGEFYGIFFRFSRLIGINEGFTLTFFLFSHYFGYYFIFETLTKGRTLGKLITKTRVVSTTSGDITIKRYAIRAICRFIPFEPVSIV